MLVPETCHTDAILALVGSEHVLGTVAGMIRTGPAVQLESWINCLSARRAHTFSDALKSAQHTDSCLSALSVTHQRKLVSRHINNRHWWNISLTIAPLF